MQRIGGAQGLRVRGAADTEHAWPGWDCRATGSPEKNNPSYYYVRDHLSPGHKNQFTQTPRGTRTAVLVLQSLGPARPLTGLGLLALSREARRLEFSLALSRENGAVCQDLAHCLARDHCGLA